MKWVEWHIPGLLYTIYTVQINISVMILLSAFVAETISSRFLRWRRLTDAYEITVFLSDPLCAKE